mgnify:CR=1 FL=1
MTEANKRDAAGDFRVSVIIPVFNAAQYLTCAVESALAQPEVGEVVLVDDGSTDNSPAVAAALMAQHPGRVACVSHEGGANRGPGESRNLGLRHASCPFIAFLDADDWYLPGCFAFDREAFAADPALGMVRHSLGNGWDPDDETQRWFLGYTGEDRARAKFHSRVDGVSPEDYFVSLYPMGNVSSGIAGVLTVRKSLADAVGGFPPRIWAEDTTFHLKLAAIGRVAFADMETPMAVRRIHAENLSRAKSDAPRERIDLTGAALLDVADFAKSRRLPWRIQIALHQGWLRFAQQYTRHRSFAMLQKCPGALLAPRVAWGYCRLYTAIARFAAGRVWRTARQRLRAWWTPIRQEWQVRTRFGALPVYYWQARRHPGIGNWGDELNRHLLEALTRRRVERIDVKATQQHAHYVVVGSVLHAATPNSIVWGAGAISPTHLPALAPRRICAVRGPLTRERLESVGIACPAVYGDPALLLSRFYKPKEPRHKRVAVVPDYIDADLPVVARLVEAEHAMLIRPDAPGHWLDFVDEIAGASLVVASSLHGLIVAEAYGVPAVWAKFSDRITGGDFKYLDFYASIGKTGQHPVKVAGDDDFPALHAAAAAWKPGSFDPKPLLAACPFHLCARPEKRFGRTHG